MHRAVDVAQLGRQQLLEAQRVGLLARPRLRAGARIDGEAASGAALVFQVGAGTEPGPGKQSDPLGFKDLLASKLGNVYSCLLYTSPSPRDS